MPMGDDHDHADPAQHQFALNAELVAHHGLAQWGRSDEQPVGAHALDWSHGLLAVAVNGAHTGGQNGFHLFDAQFRHLSFYDAGQEVNGDRTIAFGPDGQTVFLGYEDGARPGIAAVDVSDPANPREVAFWHDDTDFGPHTVAVGTIGGVTHVFSLALGVTILSYDGAFEVVGKFVTGDEMSAMDAIGMIDPSSGTPTARASTYALRSLYGHDMTFLHDEETGKDLLLVAYAYDGAKMVDVSNPSAPVILASWVPPADSSHKHYTHSMVAERQPDGRLVVVVGSETFEPENQGIASPIWILDGTQAVLGTARDGVFEHLSTWRNPGNAPAGNLGNSVHFFRLQDGLLALSHYHGGVWGIDLRTPEAQAAPQHYAYIMPVPEDAVRPHDTCCIGFDLDGAPMVFDVAWDDAGNVYAADIVQGVTKIRFGPPPALSVL